MANQVFLVGYMGAGKTSVARSLSVRSGQPMIDLDEELERREGCSISALFHQEGESVFRSKERALLCEVAGNGDFPIVSCGGGITSDEQNIVTMKAHGLVVWIDTPFETIVERLRVNPGGRPLLASMGQPLNEERLRAHYDLRRKTYAECDERVSDLDERELDALARRLNREA